MTEPPSRADRGEIGRVQTEKPDPWFALVLHVGSHVQLRKGRQPRQRRHVSLRYSGHPKGDDSNPAASVELLKLKFGGNMRSECSKGDRPVRKQKIQRALSPLPRLRSLGPRAVFLVMKRGMYHFVFFLKLAAVHGLLALSDAKPSVARTNSLAIAGSVAE